MSFGDDIKKWTLETEDLFDAIHKRSIEMLAEEMIRSKSNGGKLPVDSGNLQRSQLASTSGMPNVGDPDQEFSGSNVGAVIATMEANQPLWIGYQAVYARRMNYGFVGADSLGRVYNQEGNYFIEGAIAEWPKLVEAAVKDVKAGGNP